MNVLMIGWELFPFHSGGLGVACLGLSKALANKGVNITFVLPQKVNLSINFMDVVYANIEESTETLQSAYTSYQEWIKTLGSSGAFNPFDFIGGAVKYAQEIRKIALKYNPDLIHAHDWLTYPAAMVCKDLKKKPLVTHVHATEFDRTGGHSPNPVVYAIEKAGFEKADKILPVGGYMKKVIENSYGINPDKIRIVYNGIDDSDKKMYTPTLSSLKSAGYKVVLYLGRITLQKGPEYFVRAAKIVNQYYPKSVFVVTGSGDMQDFMVNEAARLNILDKFIFTGFLLKEEIDRIYQTADIYVMPSVSDPFGITALEAVANRTPVLVSKQSGVSEILKNALKVDFWDVEDMANKILAVLKYEALPHDLKKESGKEIKNFTWDKSADEVISVYNQLI